jgi:uncharacterized protein
VQLQHQFTVPAPIEVAWEALNDVESVGSCFPGATVTSVEDDEFAGTCKVKLGPISMQYAGSGKFVERDPSAHRAVIEAKGKDKRGNGTAAVTVTTQLSAEGDSKTVVAVDTDLNITGKPAQFGRGVIQDVSNKLLGQFTDCLESRIGVQDEKGADAESAPVTVPESGSAVASGVDSEAAAQPGAETPPAAAEMPTTGATTAGRTESGGAAALDLGRTVVPVLARRYAPYAIGVLAVLVLLWRVLRR